MDIEKVILGSILLVIGIAAIILYVYRDRSQDAIKQQLFIDSITGSGLWDKSRKTQ